MGDARYCHKSTFGTISDFPLYLEAVLPDLNGLEYPGVVARALRKLTFYSPKTDEKSKELFAVLAKEKANSPMKNSDNLQELISQTNGLVSTLQNVLQNQTDPDILEPCCGILADLALVKSIKPLITDPTGTRTTPNLRKIISFIDQPKIQLEACSLVQRLCTDDEPNFSYTQAFYNSNGLDPLIRILSGIVNQNTFQQQGTVIGLLKQLALCPLILTTLRSRGITSCVVPWLNFFLKEVSSKANQEIAVMMFAEAGEITRSRFQQFRSVRDGIFLAYFLVKGSRADAVTFKNSGGLTFLKELCDSQNPLLGLVRTALFFNQQIVDCVNDLNKEVVAQCSTPSQQPTTQTTYQPKPAAAKVQAAPAPKKQIQQRPVFTADWEPEPVTQGTKPRPIRPGDSAWQLDDHAQRCKQCRTEFGLFTRRHHCRRCGFIFCDDCSPEIKKERVMMASGFNRVCGACFQSLRKEF